MRPAHAYTTPPLPPHPCRREEFRQHRSAKEGFLRPFFREWDAYLVQLSAPGGGAGGRPGADLPADAVAQLSDEQRAQLARLREEAERPMRSG